MFDVCCLLVLVVARRVLCNVRCWLFVVGVLFAVGSASLVSGTLVIVPCLLLCVVYLLSLCWLLFVVVCKLLFVVCLFVA